DQGVAGKDHPVSVPLPATSRTRSWGHFLGAPWRVSSGHPEFRGPRPGPHGRAMAEYLVELYVAQGDQNVARRHAESAEQAGAELTHEGRPVRCLRSIFVPADETCFLLFDAASADLVAEA